MKILIKMKYDGSFFNGFQFQPNLPTIQGSLTEAVSSAFGFACSVTGCSRTDSGVHALGYCAAIEPSADADKKEDWVKIPISKIHRTLNNQTPNAISITGAASVPDDFHPRYDAVSKEYIYKIYDGLIMDPFLVNYVCPVKKKLSDEAILRMNNAAEFIVGERDFSAFMASGSSVKNTVRNVISLDVQRESESIVRIKVRANGFLYNMARIITGTLLNVGYGKTEPEDVEDILASMDRNLAGPTVMPDGLYLNDVSYGRDISWLAD